MRIKLHLGLKVTKKDLFFITLLSVIFLSIAVTNLGNTQVPATTAQLSDGQSFYIDLGSFSNIKEIMILVKSGGLNVTVLAGDLGDWNRYPLIQMYWPDNPGIYYNGEYYKWLEVSTVQSTRYLKFDFGTYKYPTIIAEIAVIDESDQLIPVQSINNLSAANPDLPNLIDEQKLVDFPVTYMSQTIFDEVVYIQSAEQYLHLQLPQASVEPAHPPLGKLIQTFSIAIFGLNPFGWRVMGVIFATAMIALVYLIGKELFGTWIGGFASAFLLTFDFLHFTLARIGVIETYVAFFSLASQLFYFVYLRNVLREGWRTSVTPLVASIVFFGLGFSTKWIVLFGFLGEMAILAFLRLYDVRKLKATFYAKFRAFTDHPFRYVVFTLLAAVGIYFLTYIPDILGGNSDVLGVQFRMFNFHATFENPSVLGSSWYSWPLLFDPLNSNAHVALWCLDAPLTNGLSSGLVFLGNPAVWWVGFVVMVSLMVMYVPKIVFRNFNLKEHLLPLSIVVIFLFQWLPYIFISRAVFIYTFYVSVPLLCLAMGFFLSKYWRYKWVKILTIVYLISVVALFILFYPIISGVPTSQSTINNLQWLSSWQTPLGWYH